MLQLLGASVHLLWVLYKRAFWCVPIQVLFLEEPVAQLARKMISWILIHALPRSSNDFQLSCFISSTLKLWLKLAILVICPYRLVLALLFGFICKIFAISSSFAWTWKKWRLSFVYFFPQKTQLLCLSYTCLPSFSLFATMYTTRKKSDELIHS